MCRGCDIKKGGDSTCYEYLKWFDEYRSIIWKMKALEKELLEYQLSIDKEHHGLIDKYRKQLIRSRRDYAKADNLLNEDNGGFMKWWNHEWNVK